jgi:glutamate synthase (NADPH/NADH) large chain
MVELDPLSSDDEDQIISLLRKHISLTKSRLAQRLLDNWKETSSKFIKVFPIEYKKVLQNKQYQPAH